MAKATWMRTVLAESATVEEVEGNLYFPEAALHKEHFKASSHTSFCPWKGTAHYYHVEVDGERNENAAWYYPEPKDAAKRIHGHVAFWKGVEVSR